MKLDVYLEAHEAPVGSLIRADNKSLTFSYAEGATPDQQISLSLPVREGPYGDAAATAYFGNLLSEGRDLDRVVSAHGIDRDDVGGILFHLGADCPGAISVTPEGTGPGKRPGFFPEDYDEIPDDEMTEIARSLHFNGRLPKGVDDPSPVAGVQPKIALVAYEGRFFLPRAGSRAPTTHILKFSPRDQIDLTRHEAALLSLAQEIGIETTEHEFIEFDDSKSGMQIGAILSTRFDRVMEDGRIIRLHSEDFCQALGLPKELKYERKAVRDDRRFSMKAVGQLAEMMAVPAIFRARFLEQTIFNLAVGNTDNHAKNSTILHLGTAPELAPLYDVVSVIMDDRATHELSFNLGKARWTEDVTLANLMEAMRDLGYARPTLNKGSQLLLLDISGIGIEFLSELGGKSLADATTTQMTILRDNLGMKFALPERDFYPRPVNRHAILTPYWSAPLGVNRLSELN